MIVWTAMSLPLIAISISAPALKFPFALEPKTLVHENWDLGRTRISRILCRKWNWVQPSGRLKLRFRPQN